MSKHYVRLNADKSIIKIFCNDFKQPEAGDICITEDAPRHINPETLPNGIIDENGKYNYKYIGGNIVERTENEKWSQAELDEAEKERLIEIEIQTIQRDQAIQNLKDQNKLDADGNLIKG